MHHLVALVLLWWGHFLVDFMLGIWAVYKTMSYLDLGLAGIIAAVCAFAGEGGQLLFGNLSDQGYRKRLIAIGVLLSSANVFLAFTGQYHLLFLLFLLTCIGSGAFHPSAVALIGSLTDRQKGLYISIFASGGAFGMAFSQFAFAHVHKVLDGNTLPLIIPSVLLIICFLAFGYFSKEDLTSHGIKKQKLNFARIKDYLKNPSFRMLYITQVCNQTIFWGAIFILPDVLVTRGYSESIAYGGGHMAFILGSAFTMIPSGYFADRFSARSVILISTFFGMIFFFAFLLMPTLEPVYLITILLIAGSFLGIVQPLAVALGNDLGRHNPGMVSAFTMGLVWCVSETVGPAGTGLLSKIFIDDAPAKSLMVFGLLYPFQFYAAYRLPRSAEQTVTRAL